MINCALTLALLLAFLAPTAYSSQGSDRIQLQLDTSEANAVLSILDKRAQHATVTDADWQTLFATVPYQRLKQRDTSMRRPFSDEEFKIFVSTLDSRRQQLRDTLNAWAKADLYSAAERTVSVSSSRGNDQSSGLPRHQAAEEQLRLRGCHQPGNLPLP